MNGLTALIQSPVFQSISIVATFLVSALLIARELRSLKPAAQAASLVVLQSARETADIEARRADTFKKENDELRQDVANLRKQRDEVREALKAKTSEFEARIVRSDQRIYELDGVVRAKEAALEEMRRLLSASSASATAAATAASATIAASAAQAAKGNG